MKKKLLSVLLCLCMVCMLLPTTALAANGDGMNHTTSHVGATKLTMQDGKLMKGNQTWTSETIAVQGSNSTGYLLNGGTYYLDGSLTFDKPILIKGSVTLCLNGGTITGLGDRAILLESFKDSNDQAHLTLTDCKDNTGTITCSSGAAVFMMGPSQLDMSGGTLTGSRKGVNVGSDCTFNMSGGKITGNEGYGVYMDPGGTFDMSGNAVIGGEGENSRNNGGVYVSVSIGDKYQTSFSVSGGATITGNGTEDTDKNVYLREGQTIHVTGALTNDASIGVTTNTTPNSSDGVKFATSASETDISGYKNRFTPDAGSDYLVVYNSVDKSLYLKAHQHDWRYNVSQDGKTITATCGNSCPTNYSETLTISASNATYDGTVKPATLGAQSELKSGLKDATITYKQGVTELNSAPTNAGTYTASITVETGESVATASVEYTINPKTLNDVKIGTIGDQPFNNGNEIKPTVTVTSSQTINSYSLVKDMDYTVSYANNTAVGTANVTVTAKDGSNYTFSPAVTENFNITKAAIPGDVQSAITGYTGTYDGNSHNAVVIGNAANGYTLKYSNAENGTYNAGMPQVTNVSDSTTVWVEISRDNYTPVKKSVTVTVSQAALGGNDALKNIRFNDIEKKTITATDFGLSQAGTFAQNGSVTGDSSVLASATYSSNIKVQLTGGLSLSSPAQTVTIPVTFTPSNTNYTAKDYTLTITLTAKQDQAALTLIPSATTVTYDQTLTLDTTGGTTNGEVTYSVTNGTGTATIAGNVLTATRAGTVTVTATMAGNDAYSDVTSAPVTITINPKQITPPAADATVFTYNGNEQTYTLTENAAYTITGNKQTVANESGYTVTVALNDTVNTKWAGDGDDIANKTYTFIIKKATITVTVNNQSIYVNDAAPDLSSPVLGTHYTVTGLVGEDILGGTIAMKYQKDSVDTVPNVATPGSYDIVLSGAEAPTDGNYNDIVYVSGTLTISARPVAPSGGGSYTPPTYKVESEVTEDTDGSVSFSKSNAKKGDTVTITVTPDRYYKVAGVTVKDKNGKEIAVTDNGDGTFTFKMPDSKVAVEPVFSWDNPFTDVAEDTYYAPAVEWALKNNVTNGTGDGTTFSPDASCTRAQIVTFLWKAAGCPEPASTNSFTDVSADAYYAKAVAWAAEQGITSGTGDGTTFSPDMECSRGQMAAFLCRMADGQPVSGSIAFTDVPADAYYAESVQWAVENSITEGTGAGKYSPDAVCTRGQMVTFLYRWLVK